MKNIIKYLFLFAFIISCSENDINEEQNINNQDAEIIDTWLRSDYDASTNLEYKIQFEESNNGLITSKTDSGTGIISNAKTFNWSINNNLLTISILEQDDDVITSYTISSDGNTLVMEGFSDLEFTRQ